MSTRLARFEAASLSVFRRVALPALLLGVLALVAACSDDEANKSAAGTPGSSGDSVASSAGGTPRPGESTAAISGASPIASPSATATVAPAASGTPPIQAVELSDLVPCSGSTYFEALMTGDGVPILAYKDVPQGTPVLFPFESGKVLLVDSSDVGISITYDVPGVGVLTILASGDKTLDRSVDNPRRGTRIGSFNGAFDDQADEPLPGLQLYAIVGTKAPVTTGATRFSGQPLEPRVTGCVKP
jgi:hypothetical protein